MAFTELQQVFELVEKSRHILIIFKQDSSGDAVSASLALFEYLKKRGKQADIVCQDFRPQPSLSYLPLSLIQPQLSQLQEFTVSIDLSRTGLGAFTHDQADNRLNLRIMPQSGQLTPADISTAVSGFRYDLIILLNTPDLDSLGQAYSSQPDLFYAVPKINIDHSSQNEHYGNINLVNISASSTSELVYDLFRELDENLLDEDIATYILSGIINATKNFKTGAVTPKTLNLAGQLISRGARRDQIVHGLYQSRFLSTLKLWGRVLSRLDSDLDGKIVWSSLAAADFIDTATEPEELTDVVQELIATMPKSEVIVLFYELRRGELTDIKVLVYAIKNRDASFIVRSFNPMGSKDLARLTLSGMSLAEAERLVIAEVKKQLA